MIVPPPGVRVWLAAGVTDMRKGFDGLAALVQQHLDQDPSSGQLFDFRGRRGDLVKVLSWDKLSLRDLIRGIVFGCEAVRDWETKLSLALAENLRRRQRGKVGRSWYVNETYVKVQGR
jgi:transposase